MSSRSRQRQQEKKLGRERAKARGQVSRLSAHLDRIISEAFKAIERRYRFTFGDNRIWGDRAMDALSRARRALDEARRYGRR